MFEHEWHLNRGLEEAHAEIWKRTLCRHHNLESGTGANIHKSCLQEKG